MNTCIKLDSEQVKKVLDQVPKMATLTDFTIVGARSGMDIPSMAFLLSVCLTERWIVINTRGELFTRDIPLAKPLEYIESNTVIYAIRFLQKAADMNTLIRGAVFDSIQQTLLLRRLLSRRQVLEAEMMDALKGIAWKYAISQIQIFTTLRQVCDWNTQDFVFVPEKVATFRERNIWPLDD